MEALSHDDVRLILQLIEQSDVEYLELEIGGTRIVADRSGTGPRGAAAVASVPAAAPAPAAPAPAAPPAAPAAAAPVQGAAQGSAPAPSASREGTITVTAPVVGVFYRAPEPGAPPYCEVGQTVEAGATIGLVEVMKTFNGVTADQGGEIVEILVGNEEFVEFGQPLVVIRPAG